MPRRTRPPRDDAAPDMNGASMRPGRNAPENYPPRPVVDYDGPGFNEAGAKCPGEPASATRCKRAARASMRPGRNAPENYEIADLPTALQDASMRPGRNAPENPGGTSRRAAGCQRFNEAGAKCPGEPGYGWHLNPLDALLQ